MTGKNPTLGGGGFHHVAIASRNFDRSVTFYTQGLGFIPKIAWGEPGKRAIMLDTGDGNYLEIFEHPPLAADSPSLTQGTILHFALRTTDTDAAMAKAVAAGGQVTMEAKSLDIASTPHVTPVRIAFCNGPDGESIEFFQNDLT